MEETTVSLRQTAASVKILGHFIDDMLKAGRTKYAQQLLRDHEYVVRDMHVAKRSDPHGEKIDILQIYRRFMDDNRLTCAGGQRFSRRRLLDQKENYRKRPNGGKPQKLPLPLRVIIDAT